MALWRRGGKRKESLQLRLWNLIICIEKIDAKCWLAEITLVMASLPLARVFQCLFTFAFVSASRWLAEIWQSMGSHRGIGGVIQIPEKYLQALLPFPAPPPERPGELARRLERNRGYYLAARRYEISLRVLKTLTREIFFQHEKRNFVSPSGHVMFYLLYKHQWNAKLFYLKGFLVWKVRFIMKP